MRLKSFRVKILCPFLGKYWKRTRDFVILIKVKGRRLTMANIYDTVNQVERELRETEQYVTLKEGIEAVKADEEANAILSDFQGVQQLFFQKQQMGEEISEEEAAQAQEVSQKMQENELTSELMEKEQQLNQVLTDVNEIIMKPIQELYQ